MESVFTSVAKVRVLNSLKNKTLNNCFTFEKFKAREFFFFYSSSHISFKEKWQGLVESGFRVKVSFCF